MNSAEAISQPDRSQHTLEQLGQRLERLLAELRNQCRHGWDINVMLRLHEHIGHLADASRRLGQMSVHEQLLALQTALTPSLTRGRIPGSGTSTLVAALSEHLASLLPFAAAGERADPAQRPADARVAMPARILVVGLPADEAGKLIESLSTQPELEVLHLPEPLTVLEELTRFNPHLIALNLHMQVCDSTDLAGMIRQREDFADVPIIYLAPDASGDQPVSDVVSLSQAPEHLVMALNRHLASQWHAAGESAMHGGLQRGHYRRAWLLDRLEASLTSTEGRRGGLLDIALDRVTALRREHSASALRAMHTQLGELIAQSLDAGDMLSENGPGYLLLCRDRNRESLHALADVLMQHIQRERFGSQALPLSVSIGGCVLSEDMDQADAVLNSAFRARRAAGSGRIGWHHKGDGCIDPLVLEKALLENRLHFVFQAIVNLQGGHLPQYQALVRLRDTEGFVHSAAELLPIARRAGLVPALDRWSLDSGLELLAEHQRQTRPLHLFISQTSESLHEHDYPAWLAERLKRHGARGARLVLEFRCDDITQSPRELLRIAPRIKALGVGLCLSGVDRGLRAAQLIDALPLDYLKLAPGLNDQPGALVPIAHARNISVIATQVEEHSQLRRLAERGVDYAQGHTLAHPSRSLNYRFAETA